VAFGSADISSGSCSDKQNARCKVIHICLTRLRVPDENKGMIIDSRLTITSYIAATKDKERMVNREGRS
jgi:hypothetical protein